MESLNLYNLYTTAKLKIKDYCSYEKVLSKRHKIANLGEREKLSLYHLVDFLIENNCEILKMDNFYYSYVIPHIGKEFDLLKIDTNYILNIELKSQNVGLERIKTQLLTNYKYLKYLSKKMYLFTFVSDVREFYFLNDSLELEKCSVSNVLNAINLFGNEKIEIDKLFKVSEFLVSPVKNL